MKEDEEGYKSCVSFSYPFGAFICLSKHSLHMVLEGGDDR